MAYQIKKDPISKIPKVQLAFWLLVRLAMLICAGYSFIHGDTVMGFESIFCFIFTHLWDLFQIFGNGSFIEEVPPLSQTLLNIIIFIGIVFGSYLELFDKLRILTILCTCCPASCAPPLALTLPGSFSAKKAPAP